MEEESKGKIIRKFVIKIILWFLLIDLIIGGVILFANVSGWANLDEDNMEEMKNAIKSLMNSLIIINTVAIIGSTILATRSIKKKCKITQENKKSVFKGMAITLIIMAVIMGAIHIGIKNIITSAILEDMDGMEWSDVKDALKDADDEDLTRDEKEIIEMVDSFYVKLNVYSMDWLLFIAMIGVEYFLIVKKEQVA